MDRKTKKRKIANKIEKRDYEFPTQVSVSTRNWDTFGIPLHFIRIHEFIYLRKERNTRIASESTGKINKLNRIKIN